MGLNPIHVAAVGTGGRVDELFRQGTCGAATYSEHENTPFALWMDR